MEADILAETEVDRLFPLVYQDVLPIAIERLETDEPVPRSVLEPVGIGDKEPHRPDQLACDGVSEALWEKLVSIERKIDFLMDRLFRTNGSAQTAFSDLAVVMNEHGLRIRTRDALTMQHRYRLRIRVPVSPPTYILVAARVIFGRKEEEGLWDIAMRWVDMDDSVLRLVRFYAMNRQREWIRKRKAEREVVG